MISEPTLTFIIPVYNVEPYVERCLNSILSQGISISECQIVILNDGSTDRSLSVVDKVVAGHTNCEVYSTSNRGLSAARNSALKYAKGKYVWFVDSDDWIENYCLSQIIKILQGSDADIFNIGYTSDAPSSCRKYPNHMLNKYGLMGACAHIFRREFLLYNKLTFKEGIFHEDFEFTPRAIFLASKVEFLDMRPYVVFERPNSITTSVNPKKSFDLITVAQSLYKFQNEHRSEGCDMSRLIALALNNSLQNTLDSRFGIENEKKLAHSFQSNKHLFPSLWKSGVTKYRLEYILFSLLPAHTVAIFKFLKRLYGTKR